MMKKTRQRGNALGGTLLVTVLLFLFGLTLANLATFNLRTVDRASHQQEALEAAEAGLNEVAILLSRNPQLGTDPTLSGDPDFDTRLDFEKTLANGSHYKVTFDRDQPNWSYNNLVSFSSTPAGAGRTVPPGHALLVAEGWSHQKGQSVLLESLVRLEAFPYAVACVQELSLHDTTVRGLGASTNELTGNLYGGAAVSLTNSNIRGDVVHVGALSQAGTTISGRTKPSTTQTLPNFILDDFDTSRIPGHETLSAFEAEKRTVFEDKAYFISGSVNLGSRRPDGTIITTPLSLLLTPLVPVLDPVLVPLLGLGLQDIINIVNRPEVTLNNSVIYVDGNVTGNHIKGTGAFFINGTAKFVNSRISATADDRLTLFTEEDIYLVGKTFFGGVMLTHGNVYIDGMVDVRGAIFAPGTPTSLGGQVLKRQWASTSIVGRLLQILGLASFEPSVIERFEEQTASASYWLALGGSGSKPVFTYWNQLR